MRKVPLEVHLFRKHAMLEELGSEAENATADWNTARLAIPTRKSPLIREAKLASEKKKKKQRLAPLVSY